MRLWHQLLIPRLPRAQLLGQHRECCALRGRAWGKKHSTVDYVFQHPMFWLYQYHLEVMREMEVRGYTPDEKWFYCDYRGKKLGSTIDCLPQYETYRTPIIYPEHNEAYLQECLENLRAKGVEIDE